MLFYALAALNVCLQALCSNQVTPERIRKLILCTPLDELT